MAELHEQGLVSLNPCAALPRSTRRLYRNAWDSRQTPYLERKEGIRDLYLALAEPFATIFAIGVMAGTRPGETLALEWEDIDLDRFRMVIRRQVRHGKDGPPKSGHGRVVPIIPTLVAVLEEWRRGISASPRCMRRSKRRWGRAAWRPRA